MSERTPDRDRGFSIIETVITVTLLSITVVAILFALLALVTSSSSHREDVSMDVMLRSAAESISSRTTPYVDCATTSTYADVLPTDPEGRVTVAISSVKVWNGGSPATFQSSCTSDPGAKLITLTATVKGSSASEQLQIVKRRSGS